MGVESETETTSDFEDCHGVYQEEPLEEDEDNDYIPEENIPVQENVRNS